ncbi:MAG: queuosine precursor transporter [Patescibacteria group bacterium]
MSNELLFIFFTLFLLSLSLLAFRLGKAYIFILVALYSLLMNIFVLKQFTLFGLAVTGGNSLYGALFLLTDLLSEHYNEREAFKAVLVGFVTSFIFVVSTQILLAYSVNEFDFAQAHLVALFSLSPRILFASMLAYIISQSFDVWAFNKIRRLTNNRFLWLRNNLSTFVAQFIDTIIFTALGLTAFSFLPFPGVIASDLFWPVVIATYIIKVLVALLDTPFLYWSYKIKK